MARPSAFEPDTAAARTPRADRLDALRGVAMLWMAAFHFCFDLNHYGLLHPWQNFVHDPFWTWQRTGIVSLFLLCAGAGQALATQAGQRPGRFWRRWAQVAGCAVLVSAGSALMFPQTWISFGVLHGIAVMLLVVRFATRHMATMPARVAMLALALLALLLPQVVSHPFFDSRWTNGVGLVTTLPATEDYVPVLPWVGVMLLGALAVVWITQHRRAWLYGALPPVLGPLATLGRWPLTFYMVHQPVLIGLVLGGIWLIGAGR